MIVPWPLIVLLATASAQFLQPISPHYQHDIFYASPSSLYRHHELAASSNRHSLSAGFSAPTSAGHFYYEPSPAIPANLFTPNTVQQPAETPGQIENYHKALEEEARDAEKADNDLNGTPSYFDGGRKSYVNVRIQHGQQEYGYTA